MRWKNYLATILIVAACTLVATLMHRRFDLSNLTMVFLVGVVVAAVSCGRGPAMLAAVLSVAVFDFGFVPPPFTFEVADTQYFVTLAVMLLVAIVIGTLTASLREQLESTRLRERRAAALYRLSHDLAEHATLPEAMQAAAARIGQVIDARVALFLTDDRDRLHEPVGDPTLIADLNADREKVMRAFSTDSATSAAGVIAAADVHVPLRTSTRLLGFLSVRAAAARGLRATERLELLKALASQTALALERCQLAEEADVARLQIETERARNALLSSVSHDLRTPLASITGAASGLRGDSGPISEAARRELVETIADQAHRLNRLIGNLLDMTRLEAGTMRVRKEWHSLEEVVGAALARLEGTLGAREVRLSLPESFPLIPLDEVLFEQVIHNLVENAHKYSPGGEAIEIAASIEEGAARIEVLDRGPGFPIGEEQRVFEKFYRGPESNRVPGVGLGLAICRGIVEAHGGTIAAEPRGGGGAALVVRLPIVGSPPTIERESTLEEASR
jgi:two-component system, OmpR family, sensor histidine kinase KdpD